MVEAFEKPFPRAISAQVQPISPAIFPQYFEAGEAGTIIKNL
jgi:hypothetical protein